MRVTAEDIEVYPNNSMDVFLDASLKLLAGSKGSGTLKQIWSATGGAGALFAAQAHVVDEVEDLHAGPRADAQSSTGMVQVSPTSEMTTRHRSGPAIARSRRIGSSSGSRLSRNVEW